MTKINLLPPRPPKIRKPRMLPILAFVLLQVCLVSASTYYFYRRSEIIAMKEQAARTKALVDSMKPDLDLLTKIEARTKDIQKLIDESNAIRTQHVHPVIVLREIRRVLPADIWLSSFRVDHRRNVSLAGMTFTVEGVSRLALALEASPVFEGSKISSITRNEAESLVLHQFSMGCTLEKVR